MKTPLSPSDIEVLIWCYCSAEPHPRESAPAVKDAITMFQHCGMIEAAVDMTGVFRTTARGNAMIRALCKVKAPVPAWIDERGVVL